MSHRTLLITGGSGYLGSQLIRMAKHCDVHATFFQHEPSPNSTATFHQCDLREHEEVETLLTKVRPAVIIHTACSNQNQTNLESIRPSALNLAKAALRINARFIHVSTDLVFDGQHGPYSEDSQPSPFLEYGLAKAQAEDLVKNHNPNALIVRPSLIYGIDPIDHQTRWLVQGIKENRKVTLFTDEIRCPIWVNTLCLALLELAEITEIGILHLAGNQALTRWEFGQAMLAMLKMDTPPNVVPLTIKESGLVRPKNLMLNINKANQLLNTPMLSVSEVSQQLSRKA
ncbi:SDR family oxidoreductase [Candidatus Nitronereus thalassa]|uniref:Sugar nucleotide-binding protein n=1 Tax=Candidatus Nitronereus thalassa TaxID=3020898 RepID=A0ABU3K5P9_9BACT|nr:sugar nucleotide-binding protein [Candidatus Nitronereus thalassa]MDT7041694.1 sugar nucleotide-binding protein [Candidatus Nitronereus thalassa]